MRPAPGSRAEDEAILELLALADAGRTFEEIAAELSVEEAWAARMYRDIRRAERVLH